jgi:peptidoglycan hydrolase CwlO-like protein
MNNRAVYILIAIVIVLSILTGYLLFSRNTIVAPNTQYQNTIDSLDNEINRYRQHQLYLDSVIISYRNDISILDNKIDSTKKVIVTQRKDYEERIRRAGRYTTDELDSFFTDRYK